MATIGVLASAIIIPAQSVAANSCPTAIRSEVSFTMSESSEQVFSGTSFGMRDSDQDIINYIFATHGTLPQDRYRGSGGKFSVRNKNSSRTSGTQYAEITSRGSSDYETSLVFEDGRRGYRLRLYGYDSDIYNGCETPIDIIIYLTDDPELSSMSGNVIVSRGYYVGDTITADFSDIGDTEGVNNFSIAWSRETCSANRGLGRWPLRRRISSANDSSYELMSSESGYRVSVWGQYQIDANHYKWVCKDIDSGVIQPAPEPENAPPRVGFGPAFYYIPENSGSGTLPDTTNDDEAYMFDMDRETIRYSISIPEDTPSNVASTIRSAFRVRNTAPNPMAHDSAQTISISYNRSFNYETAPELENGKRGYVFNVEGCDPRGGCETVEIRIYVADIVEVNTISGSVSITGQQILSRAITADFSRITDTEGIDTNMNIVWRNGPCSSSRGKGDLPITYGSNNSYIDLNGGGNSYTIQPADISQIISVWGFYWTNTGSKKWVCRQTSSIRGNPSPSLPTISLQRSGRSRLPAKENVNFTLTRTNRNLSSPVTVRLHKTVTWEEQVPNQDDPPVLETVQRVSTEDFTKTIPANETQVAFTLSSNNEGTLTVKVFGDSGYSVNSSNSTATVTFTVANVSPSGRPTITGTPQVGQTLTASTSSITDGNGISGSFSYTWWKVVNFGLNADVPQQISGANSSTYQIRSEDVRSRIKVIVSYRDDDGFNETVESALTTYVQPITDTSPYAVNMSFKKQNESFFDLGSSVDVSVGDILEVIVDMSKRVSGLYSYSGDVRMRLNIGSQTRTLHRAHFGRSSRLDSDPIRLVFHYTVEAGVSGRITFPLNGMFVADAYDNIVSSPGNANFNYPQTHLGTITILPYVSPPTISISDASANENTDNTIDFTVSLSRAVNYPVEVRYKTQAITARSPHDYRFVSNGLVTFSPGEISKIIQITLVDDDIEDDNETFKVILSRPTNATLEDDEGIGTIRNTETQTQTETRTQPQPQPEPEPTLPPITASFIGMPSEHDGSNNFIVKLRFSEDVKGLSYKTLKKKSAFQVTNGSIKNAGRLVAGKNQLWKIIVKPSNNNDISISLSPTTNCSASGAICHSDGRKLSNKVSSLVQGPVGISVADASANENTDNTVDFTVSLSRSSANTIKVNYATQDSTATAGQDYTSKSGILTFTAGEISKTVSVSMLSDSIDEGNETFTLKLSSPSGAILGDSTATGTIENSDPMPSAWLSRFGRTIGSQAVNAISSRIGAPTENRVVVGGVEVSLQEETKEVNQGDLQERFKSKWRDSNDQTGRDLNNRSMTLEELAHGTSFNLSGGNGSTGIAWSAWGQFASDSFKGKEGDVNLEGKVASGFVGADLASGHWRGGVAVSSSRGKGDFRSLKSDSVGDKGEVENNLTSIYPYFGYELDDNKAIWGTLGMGEGDLTLTQQNQSIKTDISMRMGAVGAKGPLLSQREGDGMDVILRADGMWVQMGSEKTTEMVSTESDVTRLRLTLDSSKNFNAGEGVLTPSFQMGVRHDGGDAEEGMGLEAGGGVRYVASGLTLEVEARKLLVHEDSKYDEWGVSAAIRIDPDQSGRGLSLNIVPTWGTASSNVDRLWSTEGVHTLRGSDKYEASRQLNAEISYGLWRPFDFLRGLFTPYLSMSLGEESNRTYRTGTRWKIAPNAMMSLEMDHTENQINTEDAFMLRGDFTW